MQSKKYFYVPVLMAMFILLGAGCAKQPSTDTDNTTTETTGATKTSDACGNPYYPFKQGLSIAYSVTPNSGVEGDSDYTISIASVKGSTAVIRAEISGGVAVDMTADCANGSVEMNGSSGLGAAMQDVTFKTTVESSSGTFMPANIKAGTTWNNSETVKMELTGGSAASLGPITLTTSEQSKAIGEESITIPAGTYKAMKVEVKRSTSSVAKFGAIPSSNDTSTEWWVKGIGMVKTVTISDDGTTSTIEAKSVIGM